MSDHWDSIKGIKLDLSNVDWSKVDQLLTKLTDTEIEGVLSRLEEAKKLATQKQQLIASFLEIAGIAVKLFA